MSLFQAEIINWFNADVTYFCPHKITPKLDEEGVSIEFLGFLDVFVFIAFLFCIWKMYLLPFYRITLGIYSGAVLFFGGYRLTKYFQFECTK